MRKLLIVILLLLLATGFASGQAVTAKSPQLPQAKWVGVLEDGGVQPTLPAAKAKMKLVSNAGLGWVKESVRWIPGQTTFSAEDLNGLRNSVEAAVSEGLKVCLALWPFTSRQKHYSPPTTDAEQKRFSVFAANVANEFPQVHCFFIWNEPNNPFFWRPQFAADGTDVAAIAYERLLARSYDVLKVISPDNLVIGGETASNGADNFWAKRKSQSPVTFIMDIGEAYRQSGRTRPIMDAYGHHPYGLNSAESPFKKHQNLTTIGVSDYPRLVQTLGQAFDGTAQRGSNLPIVYGEYGVQTRIPASQQPGYRGNEPGSSRAVDEATQAKYYTQYFQLASCQPNVIAAFIFHTTDERHKKRGWQSGLYYSDGVPKTSLPIVRNAALDTQEGVGYCG